MKIIQILLLPCLLLWAACESDYSPKPRGYFRIDLPPHTYVLSQTGCPFQFEQPSYAVLLKDQDKNAQDCWLNLDFPEFNARLHLSYFAINSQTSFDQLREDARTFAFKHSSKATAIDQKKIALPAQRVYGLRYFINGNTASNFQFFASDSSQHYLRGALYFNEKPKVDSIQPVLDFIKEDVEHLISTLQWK